MAFRLAGCLLWTITGAALIAPPAYAQDRASACELAGEAHAIFSGIAGARTRVGVRFATVPPFNVPREFVVTPMRVTRNYRGAIHSTIYVDLGREATLESGREYLVSGEWLGATSVITGQLLPETNYQKGSVPDVLTAYDLPVLVEDAKEDVAFAESLLASATSGTISGVLEIGESRFSNNRTPAPRIPLRVFDGDNRLIGEIETREDGRFLLGDVPIGEVWVEATLPDYLWAPRTPVQVLAGSCSRVGIRAIFNGRMRGRVLRDMTGPVRVDLLRVDEARDGKLEERRTVESNDDGQFEFTAVPAGTYYVGVNLIHPPDITQPHHPTYYPGTIDSRLAAHIVVGAGTQHDQIYFALGDRLREGLLEMKLKFAPPNKGTFCLWDTALTFGFPGGMLRESPNLGVYHVVLEGRPYRIAAHIEGPSGHTESEIVEFLAVSGHQSMELTADRPAPAISLDDVCRDFYSRTRSSLPRP
jgi:hypothetical protein